jgi:hypothetical protein
MSGLQDEVPTAAMFLMGVLVGYLLRVRFWRPLGRRRRPTRAREEQA